EWGDGGAELWDGVAERRGARPLSGAARGGAAARPPQARSGAGAVLLRRSRARPAVLAAQGLARYQGARIIAQPRASSARLPGHQHAVAGQVRPVEDLRPLGVLRAGHVQAPGRGRGPRVQTDELPGIDARLPLQDAQLPRPAAAAVANGPPAAQ